MPATSDLQAKATDVPQAAGTATSVSELIERPWQPPQVRFIGARTALELNNAITRHVDSIDSGITYICGDEGFSRVFSSSPVAGRRYKGLLILPPSLDKEGISNAIRGLLHGNPDELVFQVFANASERTDDRFGLNHYLEYAYRIGHHVTCGIVAGESNMFRVITTMLRRWKDPLHADELDRVSVEYGLTDRSSVLRDVLRSDAV